MMILRNFHGHIPHLFACSFYYIAAARNEMEHGRKKLLPPVASATATAHCLRVFLCS